MDLLVEHLTVFRVFWIVIAVRFGWYFAGLLLEQLEHWAGLLLNWARDRW
jgi:hypothetical protein